MIIVDNIAANIIHITLPKTIDDADLARIAPQIDTLVYKHGRIQLLIDASEFSGWKDMAAFKRHTQFAKSHLYSVERVALITGRIWQRWLVGVIKRFVRIQIEIFKKNEADAAQNWIAGKTY